MSLFPNYAQRIFSMVTLETAISILSWVASMAVAMFFLLFTVGFWLTSVENLADAWFAQTADYISTWLMFSIVNTSFVNRALHYVSTIWANKPVWKNNASAS